MERPSGSDWTTARGKYIAPLDADDFWFPEKLEKQVACMEQYGIETGLVYCWSTLIDEHGDFFSNGLPQTVEGRLRHALILRNVVGCASVPLFRASALEQVGLYLTRAEQAGAQGCEDWDLSLRIAEIFSIRVVPESLVAYRQTIKYECSDRRNGGILRRHRGSVAPAKLFAEWGHVRRGYSRAEIEKLVGYPANRTASFINPLTVICHDVGLSNLTGRRKRVCWAMLSPITVVGYTLHHAASKGTETAYEWIKPDVVRRPEQQRIAQGGVPAGR